MDTRTLFHSISQKMRADFSVSAQIKHAVSKGTVRENVLRNFLKDGRLPYKYGLGSGEIVGRVRDTSRQSDIIVYDRLNGVSLLYDNAIQVFPIDCVYGVIEVKSALSKTEFLDSLEKIKFFKAMSPGGSIKQSMGGGMTRSFARSQPFGAVFAYGLAGNSLDSLVKNLREWENQTPPEQWPNYICILEAGVIYHQGQSFDTCHDSKKITSQTWPTSLAYGKDSLFQFYCALHDMCAHMQLGPIELQRYYDPAVQIGKFVVTGHGFEGYVVKDGEKRDVNINEVALDKIVTWCALKGRIKYQDALLKRFGAVPVGMGDAERLKWDVYLYNPDNLLGLHELNQNPFTITETGVRCATPSLISATELVINGELYVIANDSLNDADFEER